MKTLIIGLLAGLILVPALAAAGEDPAPAASTPVQAPGHHQTGVSATPASCCTLMKEDSAADSCTMNEEMKDLMRGLREQAAYRKLQAEIDAWEASINAEYE
ncbi:MAG: hypothetical protein AB7V45_00915 [Candidatus Krumholzibacteriia bacterium]